MKKKFNREHLKKAVILGLCLGCTIKTGYAADFIAQDGGTKEYTFTMDDRISVSAPYTPAIQLKNGANATLHFLEGAIEKDQFYISSPYAGIVIAEGGNSNFNGNLNISTDEMGIQIKAAKETVFDSTMQIDTGRAGIELGGGIGNGTEVIITKFSKDVKISVDSSKFQPSAVYTVGIENNKYTSMATSSPILKNSVGEFGGKVQVDLQGNQESLYGIMNRGTLKFLDDVLITGNTHSNQIHGVENMQGDIHFLKNLSVNLINDSYAAYTSGITCGDYAEFLGAVSVALTHNNTIETGMGVDSVTGIGLGSQAVFDKNVNIELKSQITGESHVIGMDTDADATSTFNGTVRIVMESTPTASISGTTPMYITGVCDDPGYSGNKGKIVFNRDLIIESSYKNTDQSLDLSGIVAEGIGNSGDGEIFLNRNVYISVEKGASLGNTANGSILVNSTDDKNLNIQLEGDIVNSATGSIVLHLNNENSYINGNIIDPNGGATITFGNGAAWNPMGDGSLNVNVITLNQGGIIDLTKYNPLTRSYSPRTLTIGDLSGDGGGIFRLNTDLANGVGDSLSFTGNVPGEKYYVQIKDVSMTDGNTIAAGPSGSLTIATAANGAGTGIALEAQPVAQNGYYYQPQLTTVTNGNELKWNLSEITGNGVAIDAVRPETGLDYIDTVLPGEFDEETYKRLNDLRTDPSEVGVWLRGERGKMKISGIQYDYNVTVGGYDWARVEDDRNLFAGISVGRAKSKSDRGIIGDTSSTSYSLYGSYFGKERKDYFDVIFKYGDLDKDYAGYDLYKNYVTGNYDKHYVSLAMKYGRRIEQEGGWYWEPSVGATWGRIGDATFTDSQGTRMHSDRIESKVLEASVQFGRQVAGMDYYIKGTLAHDFDGKIRMSAPGAALEDDQGGTWFKLLLGASRKVNNRSSLYLDIGHDFGNKVKKPWSLSGGYRFSW